MNELFFEKKLTPIEIAQIGQYAGNVYFGKPCGLMDRLTKFKQCIEELLGSGSCHVLHTRSKGGIRID